MNNAHHFQKKYQIDKLFTKINLIQQTQFIVIIVINAIIKHFHFAMTWRQLTHSRFGYEIYQYPLKDKSNWFLRFCNLCCLMTDLWWSLLKTGTVRDQRYFLTTQTTRSFYNRKSCFHSTMSYVLLAEYAAFGALSCYLDIVWRKWTSLVLFHKCLSRPDSVFETVLQAARLYIL